MKKLSMLLGAALCAVAMLCVCVVSRAATPQDQGANLSGSFYHTAIQGSSTTVSVTSGPVIVIAPATGSTSGSLTTSYQNCFTKFVVQLASASVFSVYDGPITVSSNAVLSIQGSMLGSITGTSGNTISLPEDHLGPLCLTPGNTTTLVLSTFTAVNTMAVAPCTGCTINYEGYTTAGPGSNRN